MDQRKAPFQPIDAAACRLAHPEVHRPEPCVLDSDSVWVQASHNGPRYEASAAAIAAQPPRNRTLVLHRAHNPEEVLAHVEQPAASLAACTVERIKGLMATARYYLVESLVKQCEKQLALRATRTR